MDQFCVKCHSPLASLLQETPPGFTRSELSLIAKQGVQCDVCHEMKSFERGVGITEFRLDHHSELVKSAAVSVDENLVLFHGIPYRDGSEILFFWEADFVENKTIPPFGSRFAAYTLPGPITADEIQLSVRLRFRSLPPYLLRAIGEHELLDDLLIFDMAQSERIIRVID